MMQNKSNGVNNMTLGKDYFYVDSLRQCDEKDCKERACIINKVTGRRYCKAHTPPTWNLSAEANADAAYRPERISPVVK